ncbi:MAG TPA: chemotaxis protein CheW [bacterium]|nr:chemotaxis protein CheW [bacterium]
MSGKNDFLDLIPEFLEEARDHITSIEADLVQIESALNERRQPEVETLNRLFRAAHAIKGGSEFVGLDSVEEIARALETLFNFMRNGDLSPNLELINASLAAIDRLKSMAAEPASTTPGIPEETATTLRDLTDTHLADRTRRSAATVISPTDLFDGIGFTVSEYVMERKARRGEFFLISIEIERYTAGNQRTIIELSATLSSFGEILDTVNASGPENSPLIHLLYHTMLEEQALSLSLPALEGLSLKKVPRERLEKLFSGRKGAVSERRTPPHRPTSAPPEQRNGTPAPLTHEAPAPLATPANGHSEATDILVDPAWEHCTEFVSFFIEQEQYAVPIFLVHDIKEMLPYSRLPNQPLFVLGVVNLRGNVVPLFDLRRILGLPQRPFDRKTVILILDIGGKMTGCVVDAISDVVTLEAADKQATPLLGRNITADYVRFIGKDKKSGSFLIVLDIEKSLPE